MAAYHEITCQSACNKLKRSIPYGWDLNIYRGCEHGCVYCYALASNKHMESDDFHNDIYIKTNIVEMLEKELKSARWKRDIINIGGVTDSYQPAEAHYKLMPEILRLLIKYKTPAIISTKSDLVLRDYELIAELSGITYINIAATITTQDEALRKKIEPGAVSSQKRFAMLKEFKRSNASTGLHFMPIIPYLTDGYANIDSLFCSAKESGVDYVLPGTMYLLGKTRSAFFDFIYNQYPEFSEKLSALYKTGAADSNYKNELYKTVNSLREKYGLSKSYTKPIKAKLKSNQEVQLFLDI